MHVKDFMNENFPNLELRPALFYSWEMGIRFELGVDYNPEDERSFYLQGVYQRAITLFKSLHALSDELYIVVDVDDYADGTKHTSKIFTRYIKEKSIRNRLKQKTIPYIFPEDDEEGRYKTHRFALACKTSDIKYIPMLKAICNQDMGIRPRIFDSVYFINVNKKTIFHVYDDRGCDVVTTTTETLRDIYEKYNDWILDYDRNEIDKIFK